MRKIINNEYKFLFRNRILLLTSLGFLLVLSISIFLGNKQLNQQTKAYEEAKEHLREQWISIKEMNPHSAAHYGTYVFKPSNLLSSLDEGVNSVTGNVLRVEGHVQNEIVHSEASQMLSVSKFGKLKSSLLLQYIVPLLLIFLAFHSVSSEKQSGRLKLLILQGARPFSLVMGKTIAVWIYGIILLTLVIVVYALLNIGSLSSEIILRTLLFFLSYAIYYFVLTGLTIFFSVRWQNTTVALTSMLGIWILWTIFIPNTLMSSVEKWHPLPSREEFKSAMREDRSKGIDGHNPSDERSKELEKKVLKEYKVDSISQLPINFDGIAMQADEEYGNIVWDKHFGNLSKVQAKQKNSFQLGGIINPFISLQNSSKGFAGSDNLHHQEFLQQVENYRRVFIKQLNDKHAFGGSKSGDWGWKADNEFYKSVADFEYKPVALNKVFPTYLFDLFFLAIWSLFITVLLYRGSQKMDIV